MRSLIVGCVCVVCVGVIGFVTHAPAGVVWPAEFLAGFLGAVLGGRL